MKANRALVVAVNSQIVDLCHRLTQDLIVVILKMINAVGNLRFILIKEALIKVMYRACNHGLIFDLLCN